MVKWKHSFNKKESHLVTGSVPPKTQVDYSVRDVKGSFWKTKVLSGVSIYIGLRQWNKANERHKANVCDWNKDTETT